MHLFNTSKQIKSHRPLWESIYDPNPEHLHPASRPLLANMQPSRSHSSLRNLPIGFENLDMNPRTATSTPTGRHKTETPLSQISMATPPVENSSSDSFLSVSAVKLDNAKDRDVDLKPKTEDNVFSTDDNLQAEKSRSVLPSHQVVEPSISSSKPTPRSDRLSDPITPQNAQGVLPPEACVFVANLSVTRTDEQLELSVHNSFDPFGDCIVKVRRDRHRHPFALVQYYVIEHAEQAIEGARDMVVEDRKVRAEHAEARREYILQNGDTGLSIGSGSVILSRAGGGAISKEAAHALLSGYGPIAEMQPTTHADANLHGIPEGMWVKFAFYLDFKDALKGFNSTNSLFKIMEPPSHELRTRPHLIVSNSPVAQGLRTPRSTTDQKSIFVGNLPHDVTETELIEIFSTHGQIKGCNVIRKPITGGQGYNIFGFIEFSHVEEADRAAEAEIDIRQQRIRVEPKEYSARRHTRLQPYGQPASAEGLPRGVQWGPPSSLYQPPAGLPYGFQPLLMQQPGSPLYHRGYGLTTTSPSSGHRRRAHTGDEYMFERSPHPAAHYIHVNHSTRGALTPLRDSHAEHYPPPAQRYR